MTDIEDRTVTDTAIRPASRPGAPWRRRIVAPLAALAVALAGCAQHEPVSEDVELRVPPPTPAGMTELAPPAGSDGGDDERCGRPTSLRPFADPEQARDAVTAIRDRGRLVVGLDIGSNLMSFRDPITGDITGFDVDIAGEVARDIFGTPSAVEYRILASADRVAALVDRRVDIIAKTMSITCDRRAQISFSAPYLTAEQRILAPQDSVIRRASDLSGRRVCAVRGTTSVDRLARIDPPPVIVGVVTWADCLVALQQRQVDAVSTDDVILAGLVAQDPYLHIVGPTIDTEQYGIGVNRDDAGLVRVVNGTLERLRRDGTWTTLYRKWLSVLGPVPSAPSPRYSD